MTEQKVHFVTVETSSLDEYSQRELDSYRNIGSIREFRRLKHNEMHRIEKRKRLNELLGTILSGALFGAFITIIFFLHAIL